MAAQLDAQRQPADLPRARMSVGLSELATEKGEDTSFASIDPGSAGKSRGAHVFAVFDGHGGKVAAVRCVRDIAGRLLRDGVAGWADSSLEELFWGVDNALGTERVSDGTTATVLLVEEPSSEASALRSSEASALRCALVWVGDSAAVHVDMMARGTDAMRMVTPIHAPDNPSEVARIKTEWAVRQHVHQHWDWVLRELLAADVRELVQQAQPQSEQLEQQPEQQPEQRRAWNAERRRSVLGAAKAYQQTASALMSINGNIEPAPAEVHLLMRTLHRERMMMAALDVAASPPPPSSSQRSVKFSGGEDSHSTAATIGVTQLSSTGANGGLRAASRVARHRSEARRRSEISPRGRHGPISLKVKRHDPASSRLVDGPSTLVTRSIGDWDSSRACIPHPDIHRFEVPPGMHSRVVLASDGLWDFVTHERAAQVVGASRSAQKAADRLVRLAETRSKAKFNRLKDDTTVLVIDLDYRGTAPARDDSDAAGANVSCACTVQ